MFKLYYHPVSTASRPVVHFCADAGITFEPVVVDLMTGEHYKDPFTKLNPSRQVPVLQDGDFVLTESSAILKYLADKVDSPAYPKDLKARAHVNERMDWFNTGFYREWGYHLVYPQVFPHHKRDNDTHHNGVLEWGKNKSEAWLQILNDNILGKNKYVCGDKITIADYFGAEIVAAGWLIGAELKNFPNVRRWMETMSSQPNWKKVHEITDGFAASLRGNKYVTV
jgi:glutathione S-transferase